MGNIPGLGGRRRSPGPPAHQSPQRTGGAGLPGESEGGVVLHPDVAQITDVLRKMAVASPKV